MPCILVKVPRGAFHADARATLIRQIVHAASVAEQIPAEPAKLFLSWVVIDETEPDMWTCGGLDVSSQILPCFVVVYVPVGVLDEASRAVYVKLLHEAFKVALPAGDTRQLISSVVLQDVAEGTWGANGNIWMLPSLAKAAGYAHLQHLIR
jgi:phenylpyruvate tautomerase PptA (4-oxalocrotonate tautomerase family)